MRIPGSHTSIAPARTSAGAPIEEPKLPFPAPSTPPSLPPPADCDDFDPAPAPTGPAPSEPVVVRKGAPSDFEVDGVFAVFTDVKHADVDFTLDVSQRKATVTSKLQLSLATEGYPVLDLVPDATAIRVNGKAVDPAAFQLVEDPDGVTQVRVLRELLPPGDHVIEFDYAPTKDIRFTGDGVDFEIEMDDLAQRAFLEKYFPASFEYDQHSTSMKLQIAGASREHKVMTNGELTELGDGAYQIEFPPYFTSSSHYLHIFDPSKFTLIEDSFSGVNGEIPIRVYSDDPREAQTAVRMIKETFSEFESKFGPYAHTAYTAYIGGRSDGMEYAGATQSSLWALEHEVAHSWFARGVMPNSGNAGWLDEAIVSWHDNGYPTARNYTDQGRYPVLAGFSEYQRDTAEASYTHGAKVISELDLIFKDQGGITPVLKDFYAEYFQKVITTADFVSFVSERSPVDLTTYFTNKLFGGVPQEEIQRSPAERVPPSEWFHSLRRGRVERGE